jgi:hypothetical protein
MVEIAPTMISSSASTICLFSRWNIVVNGVNDFLSRQIYLLAMVPATLPLKPFP